MNSDRCLVTGTTGAAVAARERVGDSNSGSDRTGGGGGGGGRVVVAVVVEAVVIVIVVVAVEQCGSRRKQASSSSSRGSKTGRQAGRQADRQAGRSSLLAGKSREAAEVETRGVEFVVAWCASLRAGFSPRANQPAMPASQPASQLSTQPSSQPASHPEEASEQERNVGSGVISESSPLPTTSFILSLSRFHSR
ncbi:hypothetical protein M0802_016315 [Mischocyttarus mexicanus]|nr:hypothetical protein M0802_016315 [Mischocyttarus mexicanus]